MSIPFKHRQKYINQAQSSKILPTLLKWRLNMGFPLEHLAATELIGENYHHGRFEQGDNTPKKTLKNHPESVTMPPPNPLTQAQSSSVKITRKKIRLKKPE